MSAWKFLAECASGHFAAGRADASRDNSRFPKSLLQKIHILLKAATHRPRQLR
jgi:hypothetical protein